MSDLERANRRLRRRNAELSDANEKLSGALIETEALRHDFEANLSHELMTPITAIKGCSESLAAGGLRIPGRGLQFARIIEQNAERLSHVVEDILDLSTLKPGARKIKTEAVDLGARVRAQLSRLRAAARRRGVSIRASIPPRTMVLFRGADLARVLRHLISNAIKYNRPRGIVEISARRSGRRTLVMIRDTGIGVPAEDLPRIFDRFHRGRNARAQTERAAGLGLTLVRSLLLAGGGRIWAESAEGEGTTMYFTLPYPASKRARGGAAGSRGAARGAAGPPRS
jgi:signal transduction histidine kinase